MGTRPPRDLYVLVVIAAKAGNHHQKGMILGGPAALQTSRTSTAAYRDAPQHQTGSVFDEIVLPTVDTEQRLQAALPQDALGWCCGGW
jgi:hypothetical protein